MTNLHQILKIGSIDCNDHVNTRLVSFSLGKPDRVADEKGGPGVDIASIGAVDMSALVESRFVIAIKAASVDDVLNIVAAIAGELSSLSPIVIGLKNSAYTGVLIPKVAECTEIPQEAPWDGRLANANSTLVELIVRRKPWVYGTNGVLYGVSSFDLPAVIDLSSMTGLGAAPLEELVTAPSADLRGLWQGLYPDESAVITDFVLEMHDKTWTAGAAATEAAGWPDGSGNTTWSDGSDALVTTSVDTSGFEPGEYLVLARCKTAVVHGDVFCGASAVESEMLTAHVESTTLEWYPIGVVSLPTRAVRGAGVAPLYVGIKSIATGTMYVNCVALVPTSWGFTGWRDAASHCHTLVYEEESVYADDLCGLAKASGQRQIRALGGVIVAIGGRSSSAGPTLHTHWTVTYDPRWEQLPADAYVGEGLLVVGETVAASASCSVAAYEVPSGSEYVTFRIECDQDHTIEFYGAGFPFTSIALAALIPDETRPFVPSTAGTSGNLFLVDPGASGYLACVVTNNGMAAATVTVGAE